MSTSALHVMALRAVTMFHAAVSPGIIRAMPLDNNRPPPGCTTARQMLAGGYRIEVWCPRCEVWRHIELAAIVRARRGDESLLGRIWRCRVCAEVGQMHVRSPVPSPSG